MQRIVFLLAWNYTVGYVYVYECVWVTAHKVFYTTPVFWRLVTPWRKGDYNFVCLFVGLLLASSSIVLVTRVSKGRALRVSRFATCHPLKNFNGIHYSLWSKNNDTQTFQANS